MPLGAVEVEVGMNDITCQNVIYAFRHEMHYMFKYLLSM